MPPAPAPRGARELAIDAARGAAMFFVCLTHFGTAYFRGSPEELILGRISMVASPTFVLLNGLMLGFLLSTRRDAGGRMRDKFVDRGLFQLLVGHLVITLVGMRAPFDLVHSLTVMQVTDVVGVGMILGALLVTRLSAERRLAVGAALYISQAIVAYSWVPESWLARAAYVVLLGATPDGKWLSAFPFLPWLAWSLVGTALGTHVGGHCRRGDPAAAGRLLARVGVAAVAAAVACKGAYHSLKVLGVIAPNDVVYYFTNPWEKYPPSPTYLLFYGGVGCAAVGVMMLADARGWARPLFGRLAVVGRASWPVFVTQCFVYNVLSAVPTTAPSPALGAVVFAATLLPPLLVAHWWSARDLNHLLTVGYSGRAIRKARLLHARAQRPRVPAPVPVVPASVAVYPAPDRARKSIPA